MKSENSINSQQIRHIGHEIRNQLSICDIYSEIIKKHLIKNNIQNPSIDNALACIQNAVKLIGNNLVDLKSMSNIVLHICESEKLISECVNMAKVYIQDKNIEILSDLEKDVKIYVDESKFQGCLINILKNAVESIQHEGVIKIVSKISDSKLVISISNNGAVIPENVQKEIFNDGFTTKKSGCGVGLYLCKNNLEAMEGSLSLVQSTEDVTEFEINVPVYRS